MDLVILLPMACAEGFGVPIQELTVLPLECTYSPLQDVASVSCWGVGWLPLPYFSQVVSTPLAAQAARRLYLYNQVQKEKPKRVTSPGAESSNTEKDPERSEA
jgi:hypothetical protein